MKPAIRNLLQEVLKSHLLSGGSVDAIIGEIPKVLRQLSGGVVIGGSVIDSQVGGSVIDSMIVGGSLRSDIMDLARSKPAQKLLRRGVKKGKELLGLGIMDNLEHLASQAGVPKSAIKALHDSGLEGVAERSVRDSVKGFRKLTGGLVIGGKAKRKMTPYNKFVKDMRLKGYSMKEVGAMWRQRK